MSVYGERERVFMTANTLVDSLSLSLSLHKHSF